jgi:hypothetical protein
VFLRFRVFVIPFFLHNAMRRILLAIRVFFLTLFKAAIAERVAEMLGKAKPSEREATVPPSAPPQKPPAAKSPARSEALTLLAAMQREARFLDFMQEPLEAYSDAQVGAVVRDVHRDCAALLQRLFAVRPAVPLEEGAEVEVPAGFDAGRWRLTGNVTGEPPFHGRLVHPGWEAAICELPTWMGTAAAAKIIAPAEVELR